MKVKKITPQYERHEDSRFVRYDIVSPLEDEINDFLIDKHVGKIHDIKIISPECAYVIYNSI